jgi:hypothetical protein
MEQMTGIAGMLQAYGPYAVAALAIGYGYMERSERRELQTELRELQKELVNYSTEQFKSMLTCNTEVKTSLNGLRDALEGMKSVLLWLREKVEAL